VRRIRGRPSFEQKLCTSILLLFDAVGESIATGVSEI